MLLVGALVLLGFIVRPFMGALVLAFTLAILFRPLFHRINRGLKNRRSFAALLTLLIILVVVLTPLTALSIKIFNESRDFYVATFSQHSTAIQLSTLDRFFPEAARPVIQERLATITRDINLYLQEGLIWILGHAGQIFSSLTTLTFNALISIIGTYYLLKFGSELKARLITISPLSDQFDRSILDTLQRTVNSVIRGTLVVAISQALMAGVGFSIFGIPHPVLWGVCAIIAALIPGIGTALVMVPAVLYLLVTGHTIAAIGLAVWASVAVGLIDNFLSPHLVGRGIKINPFLILLSVLGGLSLFGPIGFLLGPLVVSFFFALLDIYPMLILKESQS